MCQISILVEGHCRFRGGRDSFRFLIVILICQYASTNPEFQGKGILCLIDRRGSKTADHREYCLLFRHIAWPCILTLLGWWLIIPLLAKSFVPFPTIVPVVLLFAFVKRLVITDCLWARATWHRHHRASGITHHQRKESFCEVTDLWLILPRKEKEFACFRGFSSKFPKNKVNFTPVWKRFWSVPA